MENWNKLNKIARIPLFLGIVIVIFLQLEEQFRFRDNSIFSGDVRKAHKMELPEDSVEVIFLGSSHVMSGINPAIFWEEEQIPGYNLASRAQTFPFSYLLLKEALKTQHPKMVIVDAFSVTEDNGVYGLANTEEHLNMNMDLIPPSLEKLKLINQNIPFEKRPYYLSSLFAFHTRWSKVFREQTVCDQIYMGFCYSEREEGVSCELKMQEIPTEVKGAEIPEIDLLYLQKIIALCEVENIKLVFIKTPIVAKNNNAYEKLESFSELLKKQKIPFLNYADPQNNNHFSYENGMRDNYHMNSTGATFITKMLLEDLEKNNLLLDLKNTKYKEIWDNCGR